MNRKFKLGLSIVLLIFSSGIVMAAPGAGPPDDVPGPMSEFVSGLMDFISELIGSILHAVASIVERVTPGNNGLLASCLLIST